MSQGRALQLIATDPGKGLHALEMLFCVALLFTVRVTVTVPALTKKTKPNQKTTRMIFFLAFSSECAKEGKNKPKHLCYNLCHLKLQWISVYFPPKGLALTILFLKIPLLQSLGSSLTQRTHTKHRSLAHSSCKIKEVQSHTSTIKNINTTGFKRISRQLKSFWDLFYR